MMRSPRTIPAYAAYVVYTVCICTIISACSLSDITGKPASRSGTNLSVDAVSSPDGALAFYQGVIALQADALSSYTQKTGLLADELGALVGVGLQFDVRQDAEGTDIFKDLQHLRAAARQGRGILTTYIPKGSDALRGHLYAIEAMADVELAEFFCSGIPLSTVDYNADITLEPGSSSEDVYQKAIALFDSAIALSADSTRILYFANVGKARALLDLGQYEMAAQAVADVPLDYRYLAQYSSVSNSQNIFIRTGSNWYSKNMSVTSSEGGNGLPYLTSDDWRTDTAHIKVTQPKPAPTYPVRVSNKYAANGSTPIILASGVEARLIAAEADLQSGGSGWLDTLNVLRSTCTPTSSCSPVLVSVPSPITPLGTLTDPGSDTARVSLLFGERAAWLYLTGHREGDMRRLVRQYNRSQADVYPTGVYPGALPGNQLRYTTYGSEVTVAVPESEQKLNPKYSGCFNHDA